jgi:Skp family chaperone for outer membrane proteins
MKAAALWISILLLAQPVFGQPTVKTGVVNLQKAVAESVDGRGAVIRLRHEFEPQESKLERLAAKLKADSAKVEEDSKRRSRWFPWRHVVTAKQKVRRMALIRQREQKLTADRERLRSIFEKERDRAIDGIESRMKIVIGQYSSEHGYSAIMEAGDAHSAA